MILIILLIVVAIGLALSAYFDSEGSGAFFMICLCIVLVFCVCIPLFSYDNYVNLKATYVGVVAQYGQAVKLYEDKAIITISEKTFTDLRYQGYQEELGKFISELRRVVTEYNRSYTAKHIYNNSVMWGWLIFCPDEDMKLLQLNEQIVKEN